jgi:hypothetical protein
VLSFKYQIFKELAMTLPETLTNRIQKIAKREGRTVEELLQTLLDAYEQQHSESDPIEDFIGAFKDDVSDLSVTVHQTLHQKFEQSDDRSV